MALAEERGDADNEKAKMVEGAKKGSPFLLNMKDSSMEIERPSFGRKVGEIEVYD